MAQKEKKEKKKSEKETKQTEKMVNENTEKPKKKRATKVKKFPEALQTAPVTRLFKKAGVTRITKKTQSVEFVKNYIYNFAKEILNDIIIMHTSKAGKSGHYISFNDVCYVLKKRGKRVYGDQNNLQSQ